MKLVQVPLKDIYSDAEFNCRGAITPFDVETLAESIRDKDLLQPIVVRPYNKNGFAYVIVVGHRRHAAFKRLKRETIPANVAEHLNDEDARALNLIENLERKDLNMLQEANAIKWFRDRGLRTQEVAKRLGKSTTWVTIRFDILDLEPDIQLEIAAGLLRQDQIRSLREIPSRQGRIEAVRRIKDMKARGDKEGIFAPKPKKTAMTDLTSKEIRSMREIFEIQDMITDSIGPNLATRSLAWAGGVISTQEYLNDIRTFAESQGKVFSHAVL